MITQRSFMFCSRLTLPLGSTLQGTESVVSSHATKHGIKSIGADDADVCEKRLEGGNTLWLGL
jgi:hypothetical protein